MADQTKTNTGPGPMIGAAGPGMLAGLRVVEVADELGEYCGLLFAGLGACYIGAMRNHPKEVAQELGVIVDSSRNPTLRASAVGVRVLPEPVSLGGLGGGLAEEAPWDVEQRESSSLLWQFVGVGFDD